MANVTREEIETLYEDSTGLDARRGSARIDHLEAWMQKNNLEIQGIEIFDDPRKSFRDYRNGIQWWAGKCHGDTIMLGYTSARRGCKNAVFAKIKISQGE